MYVCVDYVWTFLTFSSHLFFCKEKIRGKTIYHISSLLLPHRRGGRGRGEKNKNLSASSAINHIFSSKRHLLMNVNLYHCFSVNSCTRTGQSLQRWVSSRPLTHTELSETSFTHPWSARSKSGKTFCGSKLTDFFSPWTLKFRPEVCSPSGCVKPQWLEKLELVNAWKCFIVKGVTGLFLYCWCSSLLSHRGI